MCTINIQGVNITLTKDQLDQIDKQRGSITTYTQIVSHEDACKVLNIPFIENSSIITQLRDICKAINSFITIKNPKFPDWKDKNQRKHKPWIEFAGSGWVYRYSYCCVDSADGSVVYFKNEETSKYFGNTFIKLLGKLAEEEL